MARILYTPGINPSRATKFCSDVLELYEYPDGKEMHQLRIRFGISSTPPGLAMLQHSQRPSLDACQIESRLAYREGESFVHIFRPR